MEELLIAWNADSWNDYQSFVHDRKKLEKINKLIKEIYRSGPGNKPLGKAELLRGDKRSLMSVRIDKKNRLVNRFRNDELYIVECGGHYDDN